MIDPITITGTVATALVIGLLAKAHATTPTVPRIGRWEHCPVVVVDPLTQLTIHQVERAAKRWRRHGHELGPVRLGIGGGDILIRTGAVPEGYVGRERLDIADDGRIRRAVVEVDPAMREQSPDELHESLLHALGHCLGYLHAETRIMPGVIAHPSGHVMHPRGGRSFRGVTGGEAVDLVRLQRERAQWSGT